MEEVKLLLTEWKLLQLYKVFEEQEISIRSLKYITKDDIAELIPKMGPRSIFRAKLKLWRQQNSSEEKSELKKRRFSDAFSESKSDEGSEIMEIKTEHMTTEYSREEVLNVERSSKTTEKVALTPTIPALVNYNCNDGPDDDITIENFEFEELEQLSKNQNNISYDNNENLNVLELLTSSFDGRKAITFYKINKNLDTNHRRKLVNIIISAAVERKFEMHVKLFNDLAKQILEIFPNETHETYFIPRDGNTSPKGALYNKFLNLCRQLRKDGLLEYQSQKRLSRGGTLKQTSKNTHLRTSI